MLAGAVLAIIGLVVVFTGFVGRSEASGGSTAPTGGAPLPPTTQPESSTDSSTSPSPAPPPKVSKGAWKGRLGGVSLEVFQVDDDDGVLTLHVRGTNGTGGAIELPTFGNFLATDDVGTTYNAESFAGDWSGQIPSGLTSQGSIKLDKQHPVGAKTMTVAFSHVYGTPSRESLVVRGIGLPA